MVDTAQSDSEQPGPEESGLENEFSKIIFQAIQEKLEQKKSGGLSLKASILQVFQEVVDFSQDIVRELETSGQSPEIACQSGCSYCCHSQVNIIPIEALVICGFIKTEFSLGQKNALNTGIARVRSLTSGKTFSQVYAIKADLPCVFLESGQCSIYKMRPSICRSWNSFDSDACRMAYHSHDYGAAVGVSQARNFVFGTTRELFQQLSEALGLQSETLLLHNALFDCLKVSDPLGQWAGKENVFQYGCSASS